MAKNYRQRDRMTILAEFRNKRGEKKFIEFKFSEIENARAFYRHFASRSEFTTDHFDVGFYKEAGLVKVVRAKYGAASEDAHNDGDYLLFRVDYKGATTYFINGYPKSGAGEGRGKADARNDHHEAMRADGFGGGRDSGRGSRKGKDEVFSSDRRVTKEKREKREKKVTMDRARKDKKWTSQRKTHSRRVEGIRKGHTFSSLLGSGSRYETRKTTALSTEWALFYNGMDDDWKQHI